MTIKLDINEVKKVCNNTKNSTKKRKIIGTFNQILDVDHVQ